MTRFIRISSALCAIFWAASFWAARPALATTIAVSVDTLPASTAMSEGTAAYPPLAHATLCRKTPEACRAAPEGDEARQEAKLPALNEASWRDLVEVNNEINRRIAPRADIAVHGKADVWSIDPKAGDCEDYALTKRAALLARGWPVPALLVAVVRDGRDNHHAVLVVRTDSGDFVLDNIAASVRPWTELDYRWIKRQASADPRKWVRLDGYVEEMKARFTERLRRLALRN